MSYLLGGIAHATGNVSTDISKDMEYERMRGHATFLQELKNQDAASGYVNKDGVSITNKDFNNMDSNAQSLLKSKVSADYERTLEGYKDKNEVDDKYALRKEGRAAEQKKIDDEAKQEQWVSNQDVLKNNQLEVNKASREGQVAGTIAVNEANRKASKEVIEEGKKANEEDWSTLKSGPVWDDLKGNEKEAYLELEKIGASAKKMAPGMIAAVNKVAKVYEPSSKALEIATSTAMQSDGYRDLDPAMQMATVRTYAETLDKGVNQDDLVKIGMVYQKMGSMTPPDRDEYLDAMSKAKDKRMYNLIIGPMKAIEGLSTEDIDTGGMSQLGNTRRKVAGDAQTQSAEKSLIDNRRETGMDVEYGDHYKPQTSPRSTDNDILASDPGTISSILGN